MGWRTVVRMGALFGVVGLLAGSAGEPLHFVPASAAGVAAVSAQESGPAPPTRTVTLVPGWNLVGWTGNTAVVDATASITGAFDALWGANILSACL